jgi:signal transduction histidine kinase
MNSPLRILHLEDDPQDAVLIQRALEADGISCAIDLVQTRETFVAALDSGGIDLILSDFSLPAFDGLSAAAIVREKWPAIPVILVSGTLGEELAVDSLKNGVADCVLKERLTRLAPAVRRAMQDVEARAERHELEAIFIEAQKMEVIGQLVSGVAHDFNNVIAVIMGCGEMIGLKLGPDHPLQTYTEEIRHAAERAAGLTRQLLVFSRRQTVQPVVLDLNDVLKDVEKMLRRLVDEKIEMTIVPGAQNARVNADFGYICQVLMNLVVNARDAMPNGGALTISSRVGALDESYARAHPGVSAGEYVMLSVRDSGTGMSDDTKAHLFEPFFTTKPKGQGTGLGLATCKTIVEQSGGHIDVASEPKKGTTFTIYLPRVDAPLDVASKAIPIASVPRGTETLLVVEDEPSVRHLACSVLEAQGYKVLSAPNGQDALNVARQHQGSPIRLVVTDVVMPLMGGDVMAEWLKTSYPDLKILFTSGYTEATIAHEGVREGRTEFLAKPYTPAALALRVRAILDAEPVGAGAREGAPVDRAPAGPR